MTTLQVDKKVLDDIATGVPGAKDKSMLKYWCDYEVMEVNQTTNYTFPDENVTPTETAGTLPDM